MTPFEYISTSIKSYQRSSPVHGVGLFALRDIKKGEEVFPLWRGKTTWYAFPISETYKLPKEVLAYILRSYGSELKGDDTYVNVYLVKSTNFLFTAPLALLNTQYTKGNVDSRTGKALVDIEKDTELFGNYGNSAQVKTI
jgi:hypothetical protein